MPTIELTSSNFVSTVSRDGIVLVDCWAAWCGGCKAFSPIFKKVAAKHPQHAFGTLDTQKAEEIVAKLGIQHIPALLLYRDGLLLFQESGNFDEAKLENVISQAERLDMDAVRAEIEAQRQAESRDGPESEPADG
jgi:thioredoxin 1